MKNAALSVSVWSKGSPLQKKREERCIMRRSFSSAGDESLEGMKGALAAELKKNWPGVVKAGYRILVYRFEQEIVIGGAR